MVPRARGIIFGKLKNDAPSKKWCPVNFRGKWCPVGRGTIFKRIIFWGALSMASHKQCGGNPSLGYLILRKLCPVGRGNILVTRKMVPRPTGHHFQFF